MLELKTQVQLQTLNTLRLASIAAYYAKIHSKSDIIKALEFAEQNKVKHIVLSGGSNLLLPKMLNALVMQMAIQGIDVVSESEQNIVLDVAAGESWHDFVEYTTTQQWYGLQNLALIPGLVGASPVQNIGAYGVEVAAFIVSVEAYDCQQKTFVCLDVQACQFAYRYSIFKQQPTRYIITSVRFKLHKQPTFKLDYGDLSQAVGEIKTAENIQKKVIQIRRAKLPDPKQYPNVGSFFKNPIISATQYQQLTAQFPNVPSYAQNDGYVKVAAGWLIDQAGWKGKRHGEVGMFERQALVLVNYGQASLDDVQRAYQCVQADVKKMFGIVLEPEPMTFLSNGSIDGYIG